MNISKRENFTNSETLSDNEDTTISVENFVDEEKRSRMRDRVVKELIETEEKYLQDLCTLMIYYIQPLRGAERFPELNNSTKGDVLVLFSTIELIFDGNSDLLRRLHGEKMTTVSTDSIIKTVTTVHYMELNDIMIGEIFLDLSGKLCQYYGVFCNHQKEAMNTIDAALKTSSSLKTFLDSCQQKAGKQGLSIMDYLVKPFQRLLKYPLLLKELLKYTPSTHPDRNNIEKALEKLQKEVDNINKNKAKNDNMKKMLEIQQNLEGLPKHFKLLLPNRMFIYEGILMKISGKHDQERYFFLFSDCLIYCKRKGVAKFACRGIIYLNKIRISDIDQTSFKLFRTDKNLTYILYGQPQEKKTWLYELRQQQQRLNIATSLKISSSDLTNQSEKKEFIRLYFSKDTFKSFAVGEETTVSDLCFESSKKLNLDGIGAEDYVISVIIGGQDKELSPNDKVMHVLHQLTKQGIKFGNETNHFRVSFGKRLNSALSSSPPETSATLNFSSQEPNMENTNTTPSRTRTDSKRRSLRDQYSIGPGIRKSDPELPSVEVVDGRIDIIPNPRYAISPPPRRVAPLISNDNSVYLQQQKQQQQQQQTIYQEDISIQGKGTDGSFVNNSHENISTTKGKPSSKLFKTSSLRGNNISPTPTPQPLSIFNTRKSDSHDSKSNLSDRNDIVSTTKKSSKALTLGRAIPHSTDAATLLSKPIAVPSRPQQNSTSSYTSFSSSSPAYPSVNSFINSSSSPTKSMPSRPKSPLPNTPVKLVSNSSSSNNNNNNNNNNIKSNFVPSKNVGFGTIYPSSSEPSAIRNVNISPQRERPQKPLPPPPVSASASSSSSSSKTPPTPVRSTQRRV